MLAANGSKPRAVAASAHLPFARALASRTQLDRAWRRARHRDPLLPHAPHRRCLQGSHYQLADPPTHHGAVTSWLLNLGPSRATSERLRTNQLPPPPPYLRFTLRHLREC